MKIIEGYLNRLYKNDDSKDAKEIKEEIKEHLITSAKEYINQGYSQNEAQNKAIEQFDGGNDEEASVELRSIIYEENRCKEGKSKEVSKLKIKDT